MTARIAPLAFLGAGLAYGCGASSGRVAPPEERLGELLAAAEAGDPQAPDRLDSVLQELGEGAVAALERLSDAAPTEERRRKIADLLCRLEGWESPDGWFPLRSGTRWEYRSRDWRRRGFRDRTMWVSGEIDVRPPGTGAAVVGTWPRRPEAAGAAVELKGWLPGLEEPGFRRAAVQVLGDRVIFVHRDIGPKLGRPGFVPYLTVEFPLTPGKSWSFRTSHGCIGFRTTVRVERRERIRVPAGEFRCLVLHVDSTVRSLVDAREGSTGSEVGPETRCRYWIARGVGIVKEQYEDCEGVPWTWELTAFHPVP